MKRLQEYKACIDAQLFLLVSLHPPGKAFEEMRDTGEYTGHVMG